MKTDGPDFLIAAAALFAGLGVAAGAYGAHGLHVDASIKAIWETGVAYQMWHALGAFAAVWVASHRDGRWALAARLAGWLFLFGTVLFSGSLYWFALDGIVPVPGAAPLGGTMMILGWLLIALAAFKRGTVAP